MNILATAKLFKNGNSQAVRLPKSCRFEGDEVYIEKRGGIIVLTPKKLGWDVFLKSLTSFTEDIKLKRNQPRLQARPKLAP